MKHVRALKCLLCGREFQPEEVEYTCSTCGESGILEVLYDYDRIAHLLRREDLAHDDDHSVWRYKPLLPVEPDSPALLWLSAGAPSTKSSACAVPSTYLASSSRMTDATRPLH